ncbi:hypothetical protein K470DRAFT_223582 [Piedraia hortae CBS 480.64]|uniref:MARVEL domain-containing protein n=1 Tax=Piedraia hortae CBS 480.64 TaxID=1314780 RepID=A0A6A7BRD3_9PEZI|nr:hypothetical protein K470DRAFT_223582 [Piedraia hortae CBS 480.64]
MAFSGFLFLAWRLFEIITLIPVMGMLAWFVHQYVKANLLTPTYILVLFIVSVVALAWALFTTIAYLRARHDAAFVALFDLAIMGGLIAGVYYLRNIAKQNCTSLRAQRQNLGGSISYRADKQCVMLKAAFALSIINIISFFITFLLALLVHRHHKKEDRVVVKRQYRGSSRHGSHHSRSRSRSRDHHHRSSRDYDYRPSSRHHSTHRSSRREYYV